MKEALLFQPLACSTVFLPVSDRQPWVVVVVVGLARRGVGSRCEAAGPNDSNSNHGINKWGQERGKNSIRPS